MSETPLRDLGIVSREPDYDVESEPELGNEAYYAWLEQTIVAGNAGKEVDWLQVSLAIALDRALRREEGYRPPARVVATAEELDALSVGSVVLDGDGGTWQLAAVVAAVPYWYSSGLAAIPFDHDGLAESYAPLTVLHEGGAA